MPTFKERIDIEGYNEALVVFIFFSCTKSNVETKYSKILFVLMHVLCYICFPQKHLKIKNAFKGHKWINLINYSVIVTLVRQST